jgi:CubicO group peptidase (beta-lactamase class C family)
MKRAAVFFFALVISSSAATAPPPAGWDVRKIEQARTLAASLDTAALLVVHRGEVVLDFGKTSARYNAQSMRKSLLSALIGMAVDRRQIDLSHTLGDLGVDDVGGLTAAEKSARVEDLLQARSGVYHSALYETRGNKNRKPPRGSHRPGEFFYYNNWDFNALGTIYEKATGSAIGEAFARDIAGPIGMQDFRPRDVTYLTRRSMTERMAGNVSDHRAYIFMISARDLARVGQLYLGGGRWNARQIVPEQWIRASLEGKPADENSTYGYMWWIYPDARLLRGVGLKGMTFAARGNRGHAMLVIPSLDLVIVHRVATGGVGLLSQMKRRFIGTGAVSERDLVKLMQMIVAAHPAVSSKPSGGTPERPAARPV